LDRVALDQTPADGALQHDLQDEQLVADGFGGEPGLDFLADVAVDQDDAPGRMLLVIMLIVSACALGVRTAQRGR
jgi:hypothetical protein